MLVHRKTSLEKSIEEINKLSKEDVEKLERYHKLKLDKKNSVDWMKVLDAAVTVGSILMILKYEEENIITTKAFSIASKLIGRGR